MANLSDYISDFSFSPNKEKKTFFMSFAIGSKPVEIKNLNESINFSENPKVAELEYQLDNFTLLERIKLSSFNPRVIIDRRIKEIVRYVNANSPEKVAKYKDIIKQYLNEYLFEQITRVVSNPQVTQVNLTYLLGLQRYTKDTQAIKRLQRSIQRYKKMQATLGYVNKTYQEMIKTDYWNMWNSLLTGIENKYFQDNKKGILMNSNPVIDQGDVSESGELVEFSYKDSKLDSLEKILSGDDGLNLIPEELSKINKLTNEEKSELDKNPLLGDTDLTSLVIDYLDGKVKKEKLIDYINTTSKNFSIEDVTKEKVDKYLDDQLRNSEIKNMSIQSDSPAMLDSNPDHSEFYLGLPDTENWYMFIKTPVSDGYKVVIHKFPSYIEYKLRSIPDKKKLELLDDDRYKFIEKEFDQSGYADEFITDQAKKLSDKDIIRNFSEDDENESEKTTVDWVKDSNEMIIGFKSVDNYWYNFISYNTDSNRYVLEIRKLPKSKFKTISNINLDSLLETEPDLIKTFNSRKELKDYCTKLKELNED